MQFRSAEKVKRTATAVLGASYVISPGHVKGDRANPLAGPLLPSQVASPFSPRKSPSLFPPLAGPLLPSPLAGGN